LFKTVFVVKTSTKYLKGIPSITPLTTTPPPPPPQPPLFLSHYVFPVDEFAASTGIDESTISTSVAQEVKPDPAAYLAPVTVLSKCPNLCGISIKVTRYKINSNTVVEVLGSLTVTTYM